eukprot:2558065-Prymnesium_polylepis.1
MPPAAVAHTHARAPTAAAARCGQRGRGPERDGRRLYGAPIRCGAHDGLHAPAVECAADGRAAHAQPRRRRRDAHCPLHDLANGRPRTPGMPAAHGTEDACCRRRLPAAHGHPHVLG